MFLYFIHFVILIVKAVCILLHENLSENRIYIFHHKVAQLEINILYILG